MDISIIILSYNSKNDLERLLPSVFGSEGDFSYEVIIVDNGSTDGTEKWLKDYKTELYKVHGRELCKVIFNSNNGFACGNNLGIKEAKGKYLLILNPDTKLEKDTLKTMYEFMETHPQVGISTCKVMLPNGKLDLACRRRFPNPWNSLLRLLKISNADYNMLDTDENASQEIDACMGAFMLMRNLEFKMQNVKETRPWLFDEDFFMYGEDLDLCWRVKEAGYKVWYYPKTSITHYKGSSSRKTPFKALKWFHDAMWIFYKKHYAQKYLFILNWLVFFGIYLRLFLLVVVNFFKKNPVVSKQV
jgi:GT2 family glycosyltransferase